MTSEADVSEACTEVRVDAAVHAGILGARGNGENRRRKQKSEGRDGSHDVPEVHGPCRGAALAMTAREGSRHSIACSAMRIVQGVAQGAPPIRRALR